MRLHIEITHIIRGVKFPLCKDSGFYGKHFPGRQGIYLAGSQFCGFPLSAHLDDAILTFAVGDDKVQMMELCVAGNDYEEGSGIGGRSTQGDGGVADILDVTALPGGGRRDSVLIHNQVAVRVQRNIDTAGEILAPKGGCVSRRKLLYPYLGHGDPAIQLDFQYGR